jgi:hypothetical protein
MATYPGGNAVFSTKRNLLDDVMAEHINAMQDEILALQTAVGVMPYLDPTLNKVNNNYGTVRGRMEQIQRGSHVPVIQLQANTINLATSTDLDVNYDPPHVVFDTLSVFDGTGITIKRGGWWIITTDVLWPNNSNGARFTALQSVNTNGMVEVSGDTRLPVPGWPTRSNVTWQGALAAGQKIRTRVRQTSGVTLALNVTLSASFVRELPGVQVY